jgi:hypothetical protein
MPEKEGAEEKSTKSVVNKKQKQMMGEEGYDIARDMGRVKPSKDKKDATTMPVSDEIKKTREDYRKVNKGPSALDIVKKKYKGQIMKMEGLDLTKVAESFGGYIVESEVDPKTGNIIARKGEVEKTKKLIKKVQTGREKGAAKLAKDIGINLKPSAEKAVAAQAFRDMRTDRDPKFSKTTPDVEKGMRSVAAGKGRAEPQDQMSPSSGGKRKATKIDSMKSPVLRPTTGGRRITKKMSKSEADKVSKKIDASITPKQSARIDAIDAEKRFRRGFKQSGVSGDFSPTMDTKLRKVRQAQRDARAKKLGTPDPFTVDTSKAAKEVAKDFGTKPVAGGRPFMPRTVTGTVDGVRKQYVEPTGPGGSTLPIKPKRERIPADTGSLKDAPKVKKRFSQLSQDIKGLKTDIKVDKDIEKNIARVERGKKISKGADFSSVSRKTGAMKSGPKVVKQLGRTPKLGGSVVKVVGKETKKAAAKTAAKQVTKTAGKKALQKGIAKGVAKQIPGIGSLISGAEAGVRALRGDFKGAALSAGEAIPGVGLGFAAANIARDVSKAKKAASAVKTITKAKRAKDAVKVVTPTVVGSTADKLAVAKKKVGKFAKTPTGAATVIGGSALTGKGIEKNIDPRKLRPPTIKGGRAGRRSAKS